MESASAPYICTMETMKCLFEKICHFLACGSSETSWIDLTLDSILLRAWWGFDSYIYIYIYIYIERERERERETGLTVSVIAANKRNIVLGVL